MGEGDCAGLEGQGGIRRRVRNGEVSGCAELRG